MSTKGHKWTIKTATGFRGQKSVRFIIVERTRMSYNDESNITFRVQKIL